MTAIIKKIKTCQGLIRNYGFTREGTGSRIRIETAMIRFGTHFLFPWVQMMLK